jgi:Tol biopolymer transport system component
MKAPFPLLLLIFFSLELYSQGIRDLNISADGKWIAYVLFYPNDSSYYGENSSVWKVSRNGNENIKVTLDSSTHTLPRWSPDGKFLSYASYDLKTKSSTVRAIDQKTNDLTKILEISCKIRDYLWSPNSKKILLVLPQYWKTVKAIRQNLAGSLNKEESIDLTRDHLYLFDIETKKLDTITRGVYHEETPAWSPDGKKIVFASHTDSPESTVNRDLWIVDANAGARPVRLTSWKGDEGVPNWSPDGKWIAFRRAKSDKFILFNNHEVAVISPDGMTQIILSTELDRDFSKPLWSLGGRKIYSSTEIGTILSGYGGRCIVSFDLQGKMKRLYYGKLSPGLEDIFKSSLVSVLYDREFNNGKVTLNDEVCIVEKNKLKILTHIHKK